MKLTKEIVLEVFEEMEAGGFALFKKVSLEKLARAFLGRAQEIENNPIAAIQKSGTGFKNTFTFPTK